MKKTIFFLLFILLCSFASAEEIKGNKIIKNTSNSMITVWPHTVINPDLQWTYVNITSKNNNKKLKWKALFNETVTITHMQHWESYGHPYTFCYDDTNCETRYSYYDDWLNINIEDLKDYKKDETQSYRIRYKPTSKKGKWDLELKDQSNTFTDVLDPWWSTVDQNLTHGFVYLTNQSFADTFEDYTYLLIHSADHISDWATTSATIATSTDRKEGTLSINCTNPAGGGTGDRCRYEGFARLMTNYTHIAAWAKTNESNATGQILLYFQNGDFIYQNFSNTDWIKFTFALNSTMQASNLTQVRLYPNRNDTSYSSSVLIDHVHAYNSSDYFNSSRYIANGDLFELQQVTNGFGFNTTALTFTERNTNASIFTINYTFPNSGIYTNSETIFKFRQPADSSEYTMAGARLNQQTVDVSLTGYIGGFRIRPGTDAHIWRVTSGSTTSILCSADINLSADTWYIGRFVVNGTNLTLSYANISTPTTFYTACTVTDSSHSSGYSSLRGFNRGNDGNTYIDQFLVRELLPQHTSSSTYHPSFIYDSSNETDWVNATYTLERNASGTVSTEYTQIMNDPLDSNQTYNYSFADYGIYRVNVSVCDAYSCAWNWSSNYLYILLADLNITIYDEQTQTLINDRVVTLEIIHNDYSNNYTTTTGNSLITDFPSGEIEIRYDANGYHPRTYYATLTLGQTNNVNLYLLNDSTSISDRIILKLYDQDSNDALNITVLLQRNYVTGGTSIFNTVSMTRTNFEGEAALYVELYDVWYRMIYQRVDGSIVSITDPSPFFTTTPTDKINLQEDVYYSWRQYDNVIGNVSFLNSSGTIYARFIYVDTTNLIRTGCLHVQRMSALGLFNVCNNCTTSTSATLTCVIDHTQDGQFKAVGIIDTNTSNSWYSLDEGFFELYNSFRFAQEGIFMAAVMIGTLSLMGVGSVMGSILLMLIGLIGTVIMQIVVGFGFNYIVTIFILGLLIIFLIRRRES